jgi:hypothetical protein
LTTPKFAGGSKKEIPQAYSASSGKISSFGMTESISHFSFLISNLTKTAPPYGRALFVIHFRRGAGKEGRRGEFRFADTGGMRRNR